MTLIRKCWFRLFIVSVALVMMTAYFPYADFSLLRDGYTKALQASTLLFAVCTALALAIVNNYVKGLKESSLNRIATIRDLIEKIYDESKASSDPYINEIVNDYLIPLLGFSTEEWLLFDPIKPILDKIQKPTEKIVEHDIIYVSRYLLRLEDEINELGILYIRRVVSELHVKTIRGVFYLICVGIGSLLAAFTLPHNQTGNLISIYASLATIIFSILELLFLLSFIEQEGREEYPYINHDIDEET